MLDSINIENVLFLDIETVPQYSSYMELQSPVKELWDRKASFIRKVKETDGPAELYERAGIYSEFGKIICISAAYLRREGKQLKLRVKSFYSENEKQLLSEFIDLIERHYNREECLLCAHNGKEFDFPYIARRILVNRLPLPNILNLCGKKPWEVQHLDTMELWRFGDYKNYTSLDLLATIFNIPTSKDDMDGSMVGRVYYEEKNIERIVSYCRKDVITVAQLIRCFRNEPLIEEQNIIFAS